MYGRGPPPFGMYPPPAGYHQPGYPGFPQGPPMHGKDI